MKERFDAVLFDNDGVLVDTEPLFLTATQEILSRVGVALDVDTYREISLKRGGTLFDLAAEKGVSRDEIRGLRADRDAHYSDLIGKGVGVLDGVVPTLERLHGVRRTAVVTSSSRPHFDLMHSQTGLVRYFEFVLAGGDYVQFKPHPEPYLTAAKKMGLTPGRCLAIEDTERGLMSATAAGMPCVAIPHVLSEAGDFSRAIAVLGSMSELPDWLGLDA